MLLKLKRYFQRIKGKLPEYKLRTEYMEMLYKLKRLEDQVESNAQKLEQAKSSFLKNLYHEIRTPLNAIVGFTNIIARTVKCFRRKKKSILTI
jgi:two-component system sensor histidine kinase EvgS